MSELPKGWVEATLEDLCEFNPKHDPETDRATTVSFIPMPAVDDETGAIVDRSAIRPLSEVWKGYTHFADADVIFAKITPCMENGKIAVARDLENGMACGSTEFHVLRSQGAVEPDFVWRFLRQRSYRQVAERSMTGAVGQRRVPKPFLEGTVLPLPPLAEQKRIVAKLDALNAKSARARTELARIETLVSRYKHAVLSKAFSGELTREWRHFAGGLAPIKPRHASQMKPAYRPSLEEAFDAPYDLPTSWEWLTLPSVGDLDRGKSKHRPRNDPRLFDGPFPFIQTGDVRAADQYVRDHSQTYSEFGLAQSKLWPPETLCITIAANIAETALLSYPACFPDSVVGFAGDEDKMLPKYAEFFLRTAKERISQFAPATAQKNINLGILAAVRIPVASLEEQHEIVRRIESAFAKIDRMAKEAKRALELVGRLDEAILAKAFRGELVPQDENDEHAEHLLARIRTERDTSLKVKSKRMKRVTTMPTAKDFLNTKLENWPADGVSFQDLRREFAGTYDDLKEAVFASLSGEQSPLQQIFDVKTSTLAIRKRER